MNILFVYEGGTLKSERLHQDAFKAKIVFYLNPIVFLKFFFRGLLEHLKVDAPNLIINLLLSIFLLAVFIMLLVMIAPLFLFLRMITPWGVYIAIIKRSTLNKVYVGDALLSSVMRSRYSRAILEDSLRFHSILTVYTAYLIAIWIGIILLSGICKWIGAVKYHWITDAIYINNAFIRVLTNKKSIEVRYTRGKYKFHHDYKSGRYLELEHHYVDFNKEVNYDKESYSKAKDLISGIIDKTVDASLLTNEAFSKRNKFYVVEGLKGTTRRAVVLFMHRFADAQYAFGIDEFLDINEWQNETIDICLQCGLDVYIRPHPEMLVKTKFCYPSELKYIDKLSHDYSIDLSDLNNEAIVKTNKKNVSFVSPFIDLKEMQKILGMYLCITHHGSIAVESAFLGHKVIASTASPFDNRIDSFIDFYYTKGEYKELIISWGQESENKEYRRLTPVLDYILRNNLRYKIV